ncbi:hypothetical protein PFISCL1PPCAC_8260, partial [Pristionchus fissidentatus]
GSPSGATTWPHHARMKIWSSNFSIFPYSFDELVSTFWDRYPNSHATHIISEDVLEREITPDFIITKKLIVKQGNSIMKRIPSWLSSMTKIRQVPTLEESIYDRHTHTLTTYTRNVANGELFQMHERCIYRPVFPESRTIPASRLLRSVAISVNSGKMSSVYENVMLLGFKKSITSTFKGFNEKLEERYGMRTLNSIADKHKLSQKLREKLEKFKEFKDASTEQASNLVGVKTNA